MLKTLPYPIANLVMVAVLLVYDWKQLPAFVINVLALMLVTIAVMTFRTIRAGAGRELQINLVSANVLVTLTVMAIDNAVTRRF